MILTAARCGVLRRYFQKACVLISLDRHEEALADLKKDGEDGILVPLFTSTCRELCFESPSSFSFIGVGAGALLGSQGGMRALPAR